MSWRALTYHARQQLIDKINRIEQDCLLHLARQHPNSGQTDQPCRGLYCHGARHCADTHCPGHPARGGAQ